MYCLKLGAQTIKNKGKKRFSVDKWTALGEKLGIAWFDGSVKILIGAETLEGTYLVR